MINFIKHMADPAQMDTFWSDRENAGDGPLKNDK